MTEDQPTAVNGEVPDALRPTARDMYRNAAQRLAQLLQRQIRDAGGEFDAVKIAADNACRGCELRALVNILIAMGIITSEQFYKVAAIDANERASKLQAELDTPKIVVPS